MAHRNARLNVRGRSLLVERVLDVGRPVAHVAKELGVSRQCAHRWIRRYHLEGASGLHDRPSRPRQSPTRTSAELEHRVLQVRREQRRGPDWIGAELGIPPRTVSAILARHQVPHLADCDPLTGEVIRATRQTAQRYERSRPGELVHMDVKKLGRIPDGGGWRAEGGTPAQHATRLDKTPIGYDYIHSLVDDHSRFAYSEILPDEKGATCSQFLRRAATYFAAHGIGHIERVMTDNAWAYRYSLGEGSASLARSRCSSVRIVHGKTARSNASTARSRASGPTARSSCRTRSAPLILHPGSSTTTINGDTPLWAVALRSADCHQRDC